MAEGVQTIQAANAGIKGINGLIEAARGIGQAALAADANQVSFTINSVAVGDVVTVGGQAFTAVATGATGNQFNVKDADSNSLSADEIASNLSLKINQNVESGVSGDIKALYNGNRVTLQSVAADKAITGTDVALVLLLSPSILRSPLTARLLRPNMRGFWLRSIPWPAPPGTRATTF